MAIFYTDTGSFNRLEVTGSAIVSGSLIVSGGIAGDTSVFFNDGLIVTGSTILSGSVTVIGGNIASTATGSFQQLDLGNPVASDYGKITFSNGTSVTAIGASVTTLVVNAERFECNGMFIDTDASEASITVPFTSNLLANELSSASIGAPGQRFNGVFKELSAATLSATGSLTGSFRGSWKQLFVGTTAPASPAVNDLWVDTN